MILSSCYDVTEGYDVDYGETSATFEVTNLGYSYGAIDDTIKFSVIAEANIYIKSIIVESTISGDDGTGFDTASMVVDPFIDHAYGTILDSTTSADLIYFYIIGQDSSDVKLTISMVDEEGMASVTSKIYTVPSIVTYDSISMYSKTTVKTDGFSTYDGTVYHNLYDYEDVTEDNLEVQESLDIIFYVDDSKAYLVSPYSGSNGFSVVNKTIFKAMTSLTTNKFDELTNASLAYYAEIDTISSGTSYLEDIQVGDIIGFRTDYASINSYAYGMIRVNAIHPTNCDYYDGKSYMLEMDVVTQIAD